MDESHNHTIKELAKVKRNSGIATMIALAAIVAESQGYSLVSGIGAMAIMYFGVFGNI